MGRDDAHLSEAELIQSADGEASRFDAPRIEQHLAACWQCRSRRAEFERSISDYVRIHRSGTEKLPPIDESRARLLAELVQLSAKPVPQTESVSRFGRFAYGALAASLVLGLGVAMYFTVQGAGAAPIPDEQLTPGATRVVSTEDLCSGGSFDGFYPISAPLASSVFENYRIQNPSPRSYEVDYLITPALGGADDIRNLWPQPYAEGEWNAHVKDALEGHLHDLVCTGKLELETAQRDIASNWIEAYRKYFNTPNPLPDHVAFSIDPPWEN
jgi:hypothetical protein